MIIAAITTAGLSAGGIIIGHCCVSIGKSLIQFGKSLLDPNKKIDKKSKKRMKYIKKLNNLDIKIDDKNLENSNNLKG